MGSGGVRTGGDSHDVVERVDEVGVCIEQRSSLRATPWPAEPFGGEASSNPCGGDAADGTIDRRFGGGDCRSRHLVEIKIIDGHQRPAHEFKAVSQCFGSDLFVIHPFGPHACG